VCYNTNSDYRCTSRCWLCGSFLSLTFGFLLSSIGVVVTPSMRFITTLYDSGDLTVMKTPSGGATYDEADCQAAMKEMDTKCNSRGGIRTRGGYQFTLDPNLGPCPP